MPASQINVSMVAENPIKVECRLSQLIQLQEVAGALLDQWLVPGEVCHCY